jgi:hypothetical protein
MEPSTFPSATEPFSARCAPISVRDVDGALNATTPPLHHSNGGPADHLTTPTAPAAHVPNNHASSVRGRHPGSSPGRCPATAHHELEWRGRFFELFFELFSLGLWCMWDSQGTAVASAAPAPAKPPNLVRASICDGPRGSRGPRDLRARMQTARSSMPGVLAQSTLVPLWVGERRGRSGAGLLAGRCSCGCFRL